MYAKYCHVQVGADFLVGGSSMVFNIDLVELMMDSRLE
jgi:hypothetical protein